MLYMGNSSYAISTSADNYLMSLSEQVTAAEQSRMAADIELMASDGGGGDDGYDDDHITNVCFKSLVRKENEQNYS